MENIDTNDTYLYDKISIDRWKQIAEVIQSFTLCDKSEEEFKANLGLLKEALVGTEVHLMEGAPNAEHFFQVGLSTLVQSIYHIKSHDVKKHFCDQISILEDLGVSSVSFYGESTKYFCGILNLSIYHDYLEKVYTDASFTVDHEGGIFSSILFK